MFILIGTAFLGYVLPWGQISFWGATVITNLVSVIPYAGKMIVSWLWGGFSVRGVTLTRFYSLHFLLPFVLAFFAFLHLVFLHESGSSNPLGMRTVDRLPFHSFFTLRDALGLCFVVFLFY